MRFYLGVALITAISLLTISFIKRVNFELDFARKNGNQHVLVLKPGLASFSLNRGQADRIRKTYGHVSRKTVLLYARKHRILVMTSSGKVLYAPVTNDNKPKRINYD